MYRKGESDDRYCAPVFKIGKWIGITDIDACKAVGEQIINVLDIGYGWMELNKFKL